MDPPQNEVSQNYSPSFAYSGDYSQNDPTLNVAIRPTGAGAASPYALNLDPVILAPATSGTFARFDAKKGKSFGERLTYSTGVSYLTGLTLGGGWGLYEGVFRPEGSSFKLRINSILNTCGRRGPLVGNNFGALAMMFSCLDGLLIKARGEDDAVNTVGSAVFTGMIYKCTGGFRAAGIAGVAGGIFAGVLVAGQRFLGDDFDFFGFSFSQNAY